MLNDTTPTQRDEKSLINQVITYHTKNPKKAIEDVTKYHQLEYKITITNTERECRKSTIATLNVHLNKLNKN